MQCVVCNSGTKTILDNIKNPRKIGSEYYDYKMCQACSLWMLNPYPNEELLRKIYTQEYQLYENEGTGLASRIMLKLSTSREQIVQKYTQKSKIFLDIGCGNGTFLKNLQDRNYDVLGTEWSRSAAFKAKEKVGKDKIYVGDINVFREKKFGGISMWHVLEHNPEPLELMVKIDSILEEAGVLFIEVPNSDSVTLSKSRQSYKWFSIPEHVTYWNRRSLTKLAELSGFSVVESHTPFSMPFLYSLSVKTNLSKITSPCIQWYASQVGKGDIIRQVWKKSR